MAGAASLTALLVYLLTLAPTVTEQDSGELIAAAYTGGVAHPPGYPLWCLLVRPFFLLPFGDIAWRANVASAFFGAVTVFLVYLVARTWSASRLGAAVAALALAFSQRLWSQCIIAEVYTLNTALFAGLLLPLELWRACLRETDSGSGQRHGRAWLLVIGFVFGLSLTNHYMLMALVAPAFAVLVIPHWRRLRDDGRYVLASAALAAAALLVYLYLPIAASADTLVNWGNPDSWERFWDHVLRRSYRDLELSETVGFDTKLFFFGHLLHEAWSQLSPYLLPFAAVGVVACWRMDKPRLVASVGVFLLNTVVLVLILRFAFEDENRRRVEPYYLPAWTVMALWVSVGLSRSLDRLKAWLQGLATSPANPPTRKRASVLLRHAPLGASMAAALLPLLPLTRHGRDNDRSDAWIARDYAQSILKTAEPDAIIFAWADFTSFPLIYLLAAEERRPDIMLPNRFGAIEEEARALFRRLAPHTPRATDEDVVRTLALKQPRPVYVTDLISFSPGPDLTAVAQGLLYRVARKSDPPVRPLPWSQVTVRGVEEAATSAEVMERLLASAYYRMHAEHLFRSDERSAAAKELDRAARPAWDDKEALNNLGTLAAENGLDEHATRYFARASDLSPSYLTPRLNRASLAIRRGHLAQGRRLLAEMERTHPDSPLVKRVRTSLTVAALLLRIRSEPRNAALLTQLGAALAAAGFEAEAATQWKEAIQLDPEDPTPHQKLSEYYAGTGADPDRAAHHRHEYERLLRARAGEPARAEP